MLNSTTPSTSKNAFRRKAYALIGIVLMILIALQMIAGVATDRKHQRDIAIDNISNSLAGKQTLTGPLLKLSCTESWEESLSVLDDKNNKKMSTTKHTQVIDIVLPPDQLTIQGNSQIGSRSRGIYEAQIFDLTADFDARWNKFNLNAIKPTPKHDGVITCELPTVFVAVSDTRGIRKANLKLNETTVERQANTNYSKEGLTKGYHTIIHTEAYDNILKTGQIRVQNSLQIVGTQLLSITPTGKETSMTLKSNWTHPSFIGRVLPVKHQITEQGFEANWQVSELSGISQTGVNANACLEKECIEGFAVEFINPVDQYSLGYRAANYGFLFVILTFISVLMLEWLKGAKVHPVQYLLVGAAVSIFFLLLISFSEHISFDYSYLCAAIACVSLLVYYARFMLGSWRLALPFSGVVSMLYGFLFVLLKLEQTALLVGSLGLFMVLALIMTMTRRINWYSDKNTDD